jgi:hypothetical protein
MWSKVLPSIALVFEEPSTPKLIDHSHKLVCKNLGSLLPPLTEAFIIEHILICLFVNPSMKWCLCWVNKVWYEVVGDTMIHLRLWNLRTSLIVKQFLPNNFPRSYLKTHLYFEIDCLDFCLPLCDLVDLNNSNNWHLYNKLMYMAWIWSQPSLSNLL